MDGTRAGGGGRSRGDDKPILLDMKELQLTMQEIAGEFVPLLGLRSGRVGQECGWEAVSQGEGRGERIG